MAAPKRSFKLSDFKVGDRVRLNWWGTDGVLRQDHQNTGATVVKVNRKRLVVRADEDLYGLRYLDPAKHVYDKEQT